MSSSNMLLTTCGGIDHSIGVDFSASLRWNRAGRRFALGKVFIGRASGMTIVDLG